MSTPAFQLFSREQKGKVYRHNRKGIREVALESKHVRGLIAAKTVQIEGIAQALGAEDARANGYYGRSRARGYVSRFRRGEACDGILEIALRQAKSE